MARATDIWPTELRLGKDRRTLSVAFENGEAYDLGAEYLRVESPSAEVQGHSAEQRRWFGGKQNVRIKAIEPVGRYAVRIVFDDGHDTGIYPWETLHRLGKFHADIWPVYLQNLAERGLKREA